MKKKVWKQITAIIIACTLVTGTTVSNTALAAANKKNITATSKPVKVNDKIIKESGIAEDIKPEERTPELDRILNECEEIETDGVLKEIRKGQIMSVESISSNYYNKAAITENGDLYCWGYNGKGQVGNGTREDQLTPVKVLSGVKSVTYSNSYLSSASVSAITENGDLYCWGYNFSGQVGNGTTEDQLTPVKVLNGVKSVTYSNSYLSSASVSAITENGDLYCWGYNGGGEAGNGTTENQLTPVKVLNRVKSVTYSNSYSDYRFSCSSVSAITENGDLYCWGYNRYGQAGNGTTENQLTPVKVLSGVKGVTYSNSLTYFHDGNSHHYFSSPSVSAITENGDLYCWGYNRYGQAGNGTTENQLTPVKVLGGVKSVTYSNSIAHSDSDFSYSSVSAITENGDLYCWGYNKHGQVGNGTTENQLTPVKVLSRVKSVTYSNSDYYSFSPSVSAITENGDLYCWGYNDEGQVGNGTTVNQLTPVRVLSGVNVTYFSDSSVSAITENGDLYCWGDNFSGQVGNGTTKDQWTPVKVLSGVRSVTYSSSVSAITENGDLYCWGDNYCGQVGNGTTENQLTPVKVLSGVRSITYSSSVSAITENGDLYCWGDNDCGQVGNGTRENQLIPVLVLGPSLTPGLNKDGCLQISDAVILEKGKDKYITGKIFADNLDKLKEIGDSLVWSSANPSVATVENRGCLIPVNEDAKETIFVAKVTGISRGETDIFVSALDGSKACCHVVVSKPAEEEEHPWKTDYNDCFSIAGELQEVDSTNQTIKIDGVTYKAFSDSILTDAKNILEQHDNKIVACKVRETDNEIMRIDDVKDIQIEPSVSIEPEVYDITYENGKFSKKSFRVDLLMHCIISFRYPYTISDISDVVNKVDGLEIAFSKLSLTTSYNTTGRFAFLLKDGLFASQETTLEKKLDFKLKPGQIKKISVTAYVKEDSFSNENVNTDASIEAKINDDKETRISSWFIHLSNLDKAQEEAQKKLANSPKSAELKKASTILNGIHVSYPDLALSECLTDTELKAVSAQVYNWIYTLNALNIIINDDSDSSVLKKLLKKCGLTKEELQNKVFKKLGIDKNVIPWVDSYTGTLQFEAKNKNTGKKITIKFTADMNLYTLGGSAYGGWGTLKYKISSGGSGKGQITYTDMDAFVTSLKKVVESQIHNCFNKIYGEGINKMYNDLVADSLISSTFAKIVNEKYGSGSEVVYTCLKHTFTGYTEEDAKKSIEDIIIILSKEAIKKNTKLSVDCPVDVTVYDGDGNICAEIKDDVVNEDYKDVAAYVNEDDKYLILTDTDYILCYSGNDTGTMDYTVTEYENDKAVREITYNDVPLTTEKKYVNYLASGRHQGISLYNLNEVKGDVIEAVSDIDKTKEQAVAANAITLSDKTLSMEKGQSYILMETISPDNADNCDITWSSSNDEVVEVDGSGVLYAKAEGEAVITAKINGRNLYDSCSITVVQENISPTPSPDASPSAVPSTETPATSPSAAPLITPSPLPSKSPTPKPTGNPSGGNSSSGTTGGGGGFIGGGTAPVPSVTPSPSPSASLVTTSIPGQTQLPAITPEATIIPLVTQAPEPMPDVMLPSSAGPVTGESNNTSSPAKLKKGLRVKDKKTKAVYKIISTGKSKTAEYAKSIKKNTTDIVIPASVKLKGKTFKVVSIGNGAFKNNKKLKSVKIGKNIKLIGKEAFSGCKKLAKVKMGKNVTSIGEKAFNNCTSLTIITIPSKVKKIGKKAFYKCKNLQYILVKTKKLKPGNIGAGAFGNGYSNPRVKLDKSVWKQYQNIFISKGLSSKALFLIKPAKLVV